MYYGFFISLFFICDCSNLRCSICKWDVTSVFFKAAVRNFFCVQNVQNLYNKRVHIEYTFHTLFLACPESLRYTYNKSLYSDYLDWFR